MFSVVLKSDLFDTAGKLYLDGAEVASASFNTVLYRAVSEDYYLGSQSGNLYSLYGYIYSFLYHNYAVDPSSLSVETTNCPKTCEKCPSSTVCLNDCGVNEFLDHENECEPCHPSCSNGCSYFHE
jgi:hypothetical protein